MRGHKEFQRKGGGTASTEDSNLPGKDDTKNVPTAKRVHLSVCSHLALSYRRERTPHSAQTEHGRGPG